MDAGGRLGHTNRIWEGTAEIQREVIARELTGRAF
jgi:alkylation response protein AidB-like acyl-CoA dehydrogenase